ncbi:RICIN domain-containing protein [Actinoplanes subtropicus]|uniref:RICIN domain-containing protein n=1 Tax=Actinoplanes subtropicus TaxID=543632 RepID=UPI0014706845|nr:RICIN domain-containing protein [Actinoplanes subtropicus]
MKQRNGVASRWIGAAIALITIIATLVMTAGSASASPARPRSGADQSGSTSVAVPTSHAAGIAASLCPHQVYAGTIHSDINNYLDTYGQSGQSKPPGYVHTWPTSSGSTNQIWCVEKATERNGGYFIHALSPAGKCLDGGPNVEATKVWVWGCNGSTDQRWCWAGNGYIVRYNADLGLKDKGSHNIVILSQSGASRWHTSGPTFPYNC